MDSKTEKAIIENLYRYLEDKTAIITTHRIFSLFRFNKIIVMDEGRIAEQGSHEELLRINGIYADLYARQQAMESGSDSENTG